jgi:hypothetical protein
MNIKHTSLKTTDVADARSAPSVSTLNQYRRLGVPPQATYYYCSHEPAEFPER